MPNGPAPAILRNPKKRPANDRSFYFRFAKNDQLFWITIFGKLALKSLALSDSLAAMRRAISR